MTRTCAVIRHVAFEDLGFFKPLLTERGYSIRLFEPGIDSFINAADADLLIVLGGPIGVYEADRYPWLTEEMHLIRARLDRDDPTLGICLGAQLIARAGGGDVYPGKNGKEIGWGAIALTDAGGDSPLGVLKSEEPVLHWHGDTFDLPSGARLLASTERYPNQAFEMGKQTLALQFHLEVDPVYIERWLVGHAVELAATAVDIVRLRAASARRTTLENVARSVLSGWLERIEESAR